jgi:hypothetical protein
MPVECHEDGRHDRELDYQLEEQCGNGLAKAERLSARQQGRENDQNHDGGDPQVEGKDFRVERKQDGADQLASEGEAALILPIAAGDDQWMAMLFENGFEFRLAKRSAESGFLLFDLRVNVFRELVDDVVSMRIGKGAFHCLEVAIEDFHNGCGEPSRDRER